MTRTESDLRACYRELPDTASAQQRLRTALLDTVLADTVLPDTGFVDDMRPDTALTGGPGSSPRPGRFRLLAVACSVLVVAAAATTVSLVAHDRPSATAPTAGSSRSAPASSSPAPPSSSPPDISRPSTAAPAVVAWVDRPAPAHAAPPPPPTPITYPTDARPCRASDLSASTGVPGSAMGAADIRVEFTNHARTACVLLGHPSVAGVSGDGTATDLHAKQGSLIGDAPWPAATIAPGQVAAVEISGPDGCDAAVRRKARPVYATLRIGLPSGGFLDVPSHGFDTVCGIGVSRFGVPADPAYRPHSLLNARMNGPVLVGHPGKDVVYTVTLQNPTGTAHSLSPCPAYEEFVIEAVAGKPNSFLHWDYYLNCDTVHEIPAHGSVTYQMRLPLPADFRGPAVKFGWRLQDLSGALAAGRLQVIN